MAELTDEQVGLGRPTELSDAEVGISDEDFVRKQLPQYPRNTFWKDISTPLKEIPHPSFETVQRILSAPAAFAREKLEMQPDEETPSPVLERVAQTAPSDKASAIATGVAGAGADAASFFTSPLGIATLGIGALPRLAQRAVALGFAGQMASQTPEIARQLGEELGKPEADRDYAKIANLTTSGGLNTILASLSAVHGLSPGPKPITERITDAETIRRNQSQLPQEGQVPEGGQEVSRNDIQQPTPDVTARQGEARVETRDEVVPPPEQAPPQSQELVGMGGAVPSEFQTSGVGQDIYGIAERVRRERAAAGQVATVPQGKGISAPDSIEAGRDIISKNPKAADEALELFETTKNFNADAMAAVRARGEQLAQEARNVEEKFGTNSKQYKDAFTALSDWDTRVKPMQTEWHASGMAQQGSTDIDTGTFTGLQQAYHSDTGKTFTPQQTVTAKDLVGKVKTATADAVQARDDLYKQLDLELGKVDVPAPKNLDEARMLFAKYKSATKFTPQQVKTLWNAAKSLYIDQGETNFDDIRHGLAKDFGLSPDDVTKALSQPKNVKRLTDEAWKKQTDARQVQESAKRWVKDTAMPGWERALSRIPRWTFAAKVFGHGTVALGTHAPMLAFHPPTWKLYANNFAKMYKMVGSPAYYEKQVQDLTRNPNYLTARRAGLQNDPFQYEDYTDPKIAQYFGRVSGMGNRGYSVLKMLRQDVFDKQWNSLNANSRTPEVAKALSDSINHVTGVVKTAPPRGSHIVLFAPRLGMSRVAWLAMDPVRSVKAFANWKNASPAEKLFATNQIKEKAWMAATGLSLLALNQALLSATDSKQKVNMTDPMRSDFMKFKGFGMDMSYGNPMLNLARLPLRTWVAAHQQGKLSKLVYPDESAATTIFRFLRTQLSPVASIATDLALGSDYQNRPLPFSEQPVPKRLRAQGIDQYTWPEYVSDVALPIPLAEAAREVWHDMNASESDINTLWKALATTAFMAGTGGRASEDTNPFQQ